MELQNPPQQPAGGGFQHLRYTSMDVDLREDERQLALSIKAAVESAEHEHLKALSDFDYAYLAIACRGKSLDQILEVAYNLQCFKEMYKLTDNLQEGMGLVRDLLKLQPGLVLDVSYLPSHQCYTMSFDHANLKPGLIQTEAQWKMLMGGWYYIMQASMTNFQSIRNGWIEVCECDGMGFSNFEYATLERMLVEFSSFFHVVPKEVVFLNAPTVAVMIYSIAKRILSKEMMDTWKLQGSMEGFDGRLSALFNLPTPAMAQELLLSRIETYLQRRYHNVQTFSL